MSDEGRPENMTSSKLAMSHRYLDEGTMPFAKSSPRRPTGFSIQRISPRLGASVSAKPFINASPMRSQLAAVSAIKILLVGVERLILAPQLPQEMASFLTKTVTIFSVCCLHFWQRIRSIVQSEVENFII